MRPSQVSTYLGIVEFPQGFMSVGHVFDAYKVINRWPVPYADIIMYVDRTPGSPNYGFCTTWIIFQLDNTGGPGKNYWWDYSNVKYSGGDARRKFGACDCAWLMRVTGGGCVTVVDASDW